MHPRPSASGPSGGRGLPPCDDVDMTFPFEQLVGRWVGEGSGEYPTIAPFSYRETLEVVALAGRPMATWRSTTSDASSGAARHAETGFLRATANGCELVVAHGFGVTEIAVDPDVDPDPRRNSFRFGSITMAMTPSAKQVDAVVRTISVDGDVLVYEVAMAAVGVAMTHHLSARLTRQPI